VRGAEFFARHAFFDFLLEKDVGAIHLTH